MDMVSSVLYSGPGIPGRCLTCEDVGRLLYNSPVRKHSQLHGFGTANLPSPSSAHVCVLQDSLMCLRPDACSNSFAKSVGFLAPAWGAWHVGKSCAFPASETSTTAR
jgi:hypothetical protein